ncbi:hypothetical protein ACYPKM_03315 [Pseudomonas aeruginosa]
MAITKATCKSAVPVFNYSVMDTHIYFYQSYADRSGKVHSRETEALRYSYTCDTALLNALRKPEALIDEVKQTFARAAAEYEIKGFKVDGFYISLDGKDFGFAVDAFDKKHLNLVAKAMRPVLYQEASPCP